jgi:phosphonate transport system permease protein
MQAPTALQLQGLRVTVGNGSDRVEALQGIDLTVRKGERLAVIGRSGGGKSTLLRVISGLIAPDQGTVEVGSLRLEPGKKVPRALYEEVGVVFQDYGLVPQLTALQNVLCARLGQSGFRASLGQFTAEERLQAEELLVSLGLHDRVHTRASRLSGGEKQRVAIARLLLQAPSVMLLDEPVASLDVHWAAQALHTLTRRADDQTTVVMVLHDLWMARRFADRVVLLHEGVIVYDGDPEEACRRMEALGLTEPPVDADGTVEEPTADPQPADPPAPAIQDLSSAAPLPATTTSPAEGGLLKRTTFYGLLLSAAIVLYIWAALGVDFSLRRIFSNLDHAVDFMTRMVPPDFSVTATVAASLLETLQMALIGTTLAAFLSLPLAVMAARNTAARPVQAVARLILNLLRTVPSIIWGLFFVAIVGLGPFPGILALTFYASGYLGKFYYEGIESIDPRPLQSLTTVGASPFQKFRWGVFPQVLPLMAGYTLYMFEYNVRAASILGIVGAGGIGFYLYTYISNFQYDRAATALLLLLVVVTLIDAASSALRARLSDAT